MNIFNPKVLFLLLLIIPGLFLLYILYVYQRGNFFLLGGQKSQEPCFKRNFWTYWAVFIWSYVWVILAWADITAGKRFVRRSVSGLEIVFVMDVSRSMLTRDIPPESRLSTSKNIVCDIVYGLSSARMGLVFFKGEGMVASPLTEDKDFLTGMIAYADPNMLTAKGTNTGSGLLVGNSLFSTSTETKKFLILLGDGGDLSGDLLHVLRTIHASGTSVISVGIATVAGAELPESGEKGKPIFTKLEEAPLKTSASLTNGKYFPYQHTVSTQIIQYLEEYQKGSSQLEQESYSLSYLFIVLALGNILLSAYLRGTQWKKCFLLS